MKQKGWEADDRAVSKVVAIVLLVGITTVVAGVAGGVLLGISEESQETPQANFEFAWDGSVLTVEHGGGHTYDEENTGGEKVGCESSAILVQTGGEVIDCWAVPIWLNDEFSIDGDESDPGSAYDGTPEAVESGDLVRLVWVSPDGDRTQILASFEVDEG